MHHVLCGLAGNTALPSELVDRLIAIADEDVADSLAGRPDLSHAQAVELASRVPESGPLLAYRGRLTAADVDPSAQPLTALALLDERSGNPEWARLLAADPLVERREKLAGCPGLPSDVVETLAHDSHIAVVAELALWATPDVAAGLAGHPHAEVRRAVAVNEATPPAVLAALLSDEGLPPARWCLVCDGGTTPCADDPQGRQPSRDLPSGAFCDGAHESTVHDIRQAALGNPATPVDAVVDFAAHPSVLLRWALVSRTDLPAEVYRLLAADPVPAIRADLAGNSAIDESLIRILADDRGHDVQRSLAHHPDVPLDVLVRLASTCKIGPTLPPRIAAARLDEVESLAQSPTSAVRMLTALRRDLPAGVRDALATDPDAKVVKSVAPHPGFDEAHLRGMVERYGVQVAAGVAANPDATAELLCDLARHRPTAARAWREIARHPHATGPALLACLTDGRARRTAAGHPALPASAIQELLTDPDWLVVEAAAANPSLPHGVMWDLVAS
ncbi:hypothetical protein [Streptomyces sp. NPDC054842]